MRIWIGHFFDVCAVGRHGPCVRIRQGNEQKVIPFATALDRCDTTGGFGNLYEAGDPQFLPIYPTMVRHVWITDPEPVRSCDFWTAELRLVRPDHTLVWDLRGYIADLEALDHRV